jgi:hypothetical protein
MNTETQNKSIYDGRTFLNGILNTWVENAKINGPATVFELQRVNQL